MNIGVIGLGLIGGSVAKSIKANTNHQVFGMDKEKSVILRAVLLDAIDKELSVDMLSECDMVIVALYPKDTVECIKEIAPHIKKEAIVIDCCGVKKAVCEPVWEVAKEYGFTFIGGHPMAGVEHSGFSFATQAMFKGASMILTPEDGLDIAVLDSLRRFFISIGFGSIKIAKPGEHDEIIAYTSQLAHVLSSAYIKSDTALRHIGFSAGSFQDMTRVATLHENMWTELFLLNKENLSKEIEGLAKRLLEYKEAIDEENGEKLIKLLREGREQKEVVSNGGAVL